MSRKQRKIKGGDIRYGNYFGDLQNIELTADDNKQDVTVGQVKPYLLADLNRGIDTLTSKSETFVDNQSWKKYVNDEINAIRSLNTMSEKALVACIGAYNVKQRREDDLTMTMDRAKTAYNGQENDALKRVKSSYPCGSNTCKDRGHRIKAALYNLASYSPEALGDIGVISVASSGLDWTSKFVGMKDKTPQANALVPSTPTSNSSWWPFSRKTDKVGGRRTRRKK